MLSCTVLRSRPIESPIETPIGTRVPIHPHSLAYPLFFTPALFCCESPTSFVSCHSPFSLRRLPASLACLLACLLTVAPLSVQGPLVGEKTPSTAITDEYAKADPVYVQKTMVRSKVTHLSWSCVSICPILTRLQALPQTYSDYRPIQGDGNCGWRGEPSPISSPRGSEEPTDWDADIPRRSHCI